MKAIFWKILLAKNSHYKKERFFSQKWQFSVFRVALQTFFWKKGNSFGEYPYKNSYFRKLKF